MRWIVSRDEGIPVSLRRNNVRFPVLDPHTGYRGRSLFLPRALVAEDPIRTALTFVVGKDDSYCAVINHKHHLEVPRSFLDEATLRHLGIPLVDLVSDIQFEPIDLEPKSSFSLRTRQKPALKAYLENGDGTITLACGLGKTIIGWAIAAELKVPTLLVSPQGAHMQNWEDELRRYFNFNGTLGYVGGGREEYDCDIVLATVQTLAKRSMEGGLPTEFYWRFGLVIYDECFPSGTKISTPTGDASIESIKVGDIVLSPTEDGRVRHNAVTAVSSKPDREIFRVVHKQGELFCTGEHPLLTTEGWVTARDITSTHTLLTLPGASILQHSRVGGCTQLRTRCTVFNLEVERDHTYFADRVAVHNCHHMAARYFSMAADLGLGRRLGLTATVNRVDMNERLFLNHIGPVRYTDLKQDLMCSVRINLTYAQPTEEDEEEFKDVTGSRHLAYIRRYLYENPDRNNVIRNRIDKRLAEGRTVYVLTHGPDHVELLHSMYEGSGCIHGGTPNADRLVELQKNPVFATIGVGAEAYNRKELDTLFLVSPFAAKSHAAPVAQQTLGRIQRALPGKKDPVCELFMDRSIDECKGMIYSLIRYFKTEGHTIEDGEWNQSTCRPLRHTSRT